MASLGDTVWLDTNANGIQDLGESGVGGVTVNLLDGAGTVISTTTTAGDGTYSFVNLMDGDYAVQFTLPSGYTFSPQGQGSDDATDSDADTSTGKTATTTLARSEVDLTWDAGIYQLASLGDYVWWDQDDDGIQDASEPGLEGITVTLKDAGGNTIASTTTDANGAYNFSDLVPGDYNVTFSLPNSDWSFSPQDQGSDNSIDSDANTGSGTTTNTTLESGEQDTTFDAGMTLPSSYTLTKENTTVETELAPSDPISFTITIENTGKTWLASIPMTDTYETEYLTFESATPATDDTKNDGNLDWSDLVTSFGQMLAPGGSFSVVVNFTANPPTQDLPNQVTLNYAETHNVTTDPDGPSGPNGATGSLPDQQDDAPVNILSTRLEISSLFGDDIPTTAVSIKR